MSPSRHRPTPTDVSGRLTILEATAYNVEQILATLQQESRDNREGVRSVTQSQASTTAVLEKLEGRTDAHERFIQRAWGAMIAAGAVAGVLSWAIPQLASVIGHLIK